MSSYPDAAHTRAVTCCQNLSCRSQEGFRGPFDGKPNAFFVFTRSYYCVRCWWRASEKLFDGKAYRQSLKDDAGKHRPSTRR